MSLLLITLLGALVAGCSMGPQYDRPRSATPTAWQNRSEQLDGWPTLDWWRGFEAPRLDQYMKEAQETNFDIGAAVARIREADAQLKIAGGALLPNVQASLGASRSRSQSTSRVSANPEAPQVGISAYHAVFSASYQLDFWGRYADQVESAGSAASATRFDKETTGLTVEANVANTYFAMAAFQDRIKVAKANLANAEHVLEAFRARQAAGTASGLDIAQQESVVAEQRAVLPPLTQQLRQNLVALAILTGRIPEEMAMPEASLDGIAAPAVAAGLPSLLLTRRPDVQFAEAQLREANADLKAAQAALFPNIALTAQGGMQTTALSALFSPGSVLYSIGASVTQPIFEGGALEGDVELRQARYDELVQTYRKAVASAFGDVENTLSAVEETARQEQEQERAVETAQRANDIAQAQLYSGTVDILTVLNTQRTLFQAQDLLVQAKLAHIQATVSLFKALGGGWQSNG